MLFSDDAQHFLKRRLRQFHLKQSVFKHRLHPFRPRRRAQCLKAEILLQHNLFDRFVYLEQLVDAEAAAVPRHSARGTSLPAIGDPRSFRFALFHTQLLELPRHDRHNVGAGFIGIQARLADLPHQTLRNDKVQNRHRKEGRNIQVKEARHGGRRVVRVERRQDQVAGQRRLHGDLGGLGVADLADHDDVRILPQKRRASPTRT